MLRRATVLQQNHGCLPLRGHWQGRAQHIHCQPDSSNNVVVSVWNGPRNPMAKTAQMRYAAGAHAPPCLRTQGVSSSAVTTFMVLLAAGTTSASNTRLAWYRHCARSIFAACGNPACAVDCNALRVAGSSPGLRTRCQLPLQIGIYAISSTYRKLMGQEPC